MNRKDAMVMLAEFEENQKNRKRLSQVDWNWWRSIMPDVPEDVLEMMVGFSSEPSPELLPWNRRQRRRHQRSRGLVIHLFFGADTGRWKGTLPDDMDWIFLDLELGDGFNVHNANVWSYVCSLARSGKVKGVVGGPPCRTTSRGATRTKEGERPWR